ncbi:MAG: chitobiase/beta-hexosaminidase C-terminal domain-containing protein, partial [Coriobacteriia bacterium]|nr:chitobiase/beta-hexosaminidase C-terminal domain-containing protein [Coriobacteriia bacterium]
MGTQHRSRMRLAGAAFAATAAVVFALSSAAPALGAVDRTVRISPATEVMNASANPSVSADNKYVCFSSEASNVLPEGQDLNGVSDVFVYDRTTAITERVSVDAGGIEANGWSGSPTISANGRWVAFLSYATNLTPDRTAGLLALFLKDRETGAITCITPAVADLGNTAIRPSLSANGEYVTFQSSADDIVLPDTNTTSDVFLYSHAAGTIERISVDVRNAMAQVWGESVNPVINANGTLIVFQSDAPTLVDGDTNGVNDIFMWDRTNPSDPACTRVSVAQDGTQADGPSSFPTISSDGLVVAFASFATNLTADTNNGFSDIVVKTLSGGAIRNMTKDGNANVVTDTVSLDADGSHVAFSSEASNLVQGDYNTFADVFVATTADGVVTRQSLHTYGREGDGPSGSPWLDQAADYVAFSSFATQLVDTPDTNETTDIFVRDTHPDLTPAVTVALPTPATPTGADSWYLIAPTIALVSDEPSVIRYQWDSVEPSTFNDYTGPLASMDGTHTLYYYSTDTAANRETTKSVTYKVDTEPPRSSDNATSFYYDSASIALTASDSVSGIVGTWWRVDGTPPSYLAGSVATNTAPGVHTLEHYATDRAGNSGNVVATPFMVADKHEETDPYITYGSTYKWSTLTGSQYSANSAKRGRGTGAGFTVKFTGPAIEWIGSKTPDGGRARVSIDAGTPFYVDLYRSTALHQQVLYSNRNLGSGDHQIRVDWTSTLLPGATNNYINADAFYIAGDLNQSPPWSSNAAHYEENDTMVSYGTTWTVVDEPLAGEGQLRTMAGEGTGYTVKFVGSTLELTGRRAPDLGIAHLTVDGADAGTIDFYQSTTSENNLLYSKQDFTEETHTVRVDWTGTKNAASTGTTISLDGIDISGEMIQAPPHISRYENTDVRAYWQGAWAYDVNGAYSGSSRMNASAPGQKAYLNFYGERVNIISSTGPDQGIALVSVDGGAPVTADQYSLVPNHQVTVASITGLTRANHRVTVEYSGTKNGASSGYGVNVDAFDVVGAPVTDTVVPHTTDDANPAWRTSNATITLTGTDVDSFVASTRYRTGNGSTTYTVPFTISAENTTVIEYSSIDAAGNRETSHTATIRIDRTGPTSSDNAPTAWQKSPVTVSLAATDLASGLATITYSLDGNTPTTPYTAPITISADGTTTLKYRATDNVGNTTDKSVEVRVDKVLPYSSSNAPSGWASSTVNVAISATDTLSGVFARMYKLDSSAVTTYSGTFPVSAEGTHTLWFYALDVAGNQETSNVVQVRVDTSVPTISSDAPGGWVNGPVYVHLTSGDAVSGVESVKYSLDGGEPTTTYGSYITVSAEGTTTVRYIATDRAGNSTAGTSTVRIDNNAPRVTHDAPSEWASATVTMHLTLESTSGVASTLYSIDGGTPTTPYAGGIVVSAEGTNTVRYRVTNTAGNATEGTAAVRIDRGAPTISSNANPAWTTQPVTVTLTGADVVSGLAAISYSTNGGAPTTPYLAGVSITNEGTTTLRFRATDRSGNATESASMIRIDRVAPVTTSNAVSSYINTASITLNATDAGSGVASTMWRIDGGAWTAGTVVSTTAVGAHTVEWYSSDAVGNVEATIASQFTVIARVEQTDPSIYYKGTWTTYNLGLFSAGSMAYTNSAGGGAHVAFNGTAITWINHKTTSYGIARVSIDGTQVATVDLYSPGLQAKQSVFATSGLTPGRHTLKIEVTGSKNASSSGTYIGVDAIDVTGELLPDTAKPVTLDDAVSAWRSSGVTVTLAPADEHTWVTSTRYALNSAAPSTYTVPFAVTAEGTTTIEYRSIDGAGNTEETKTAQVRIDRTAPEVSDDAPNDWVAAPVSVHLSATDSASGLDQILYGSDLLDPATPYSSGIAVSENGTTTLRYKATDVLGNTSSISSVMIRVDTLAPDSSDDATDAWAKGPLAVNLSANDTYSGVVGTLFGVDGSEMTTASGPVVISAEGTHTLRYRSVDVAGNLEDTRTKTIRVDSTPPTSSCNATSAYASTATITFSATDALSGLAKTEYNLDGAGWVEGTSTVTAVGGPHQLQWRATDRVGNVEAVRSTNFTVTRRVEQTDPSIYYSGTWSTYNLGLFSAGSMTYSNSLGSCVDFAFNGTAINWITHKTNNYGIARVSIDGTQVATVDLYSPSL